MATTINKQRLLSALFATVGKEGGAQGQPRPVLDDVIYAICRENATREQADRAFLFLQEHFFDWNEVRVSGVRELEEAFEGMPDAEQRAGRVIAFLQSHFEATFSFDLEGLHKKGLKEAVKQLKRYDAVKGNDFTTGWVTQRSLGGHAIPLDTPTARCARRLGLVDTDDAESARSTLEHLIPKAKGALFTDAISTVAVEYCWEERPHCGACPLAGDCPTAHELGVEAPPQRKPKPR